jgi:hypothetical protein
MRTTIRLNDDVLARAKIRAAETGRTLTRVIEDALRRDLDGTASPGEPPPIEIPTAGSGGLLPGVDLDDTSALLDRMEGLP